MSYHDVKRRLDAGEIIVIDGGTGTELQRRGAVCDGEHERGDHEQVRERQRERTDDEYEQAEPDGQATKRKDAVDEPVHRRPLPLEAVPNTAHGVDSRRCRWIGLDLLAEVTHVDVDGARLAEVG